MPDRQLRATRRHCSLEAAFTTIVRAAMRPASFLKDRFGWPWTRDWVGVAMHDPPFSVLTPKDGGHA
jgi:hypothetical protein